MRLPCTVTSALWVMGLEHEPHFINYHRVLRRARWSSLQASKILLGLLVCLLSPSLPILIGIDETIERRKGDKIAAKGVYRDAVRSTQKHVIRCFGLKWIAMMMLVKLPASKRGPKPKKGKRLPSLETLSQDANQPWETVLLNWYGNTKQTRDILTGTALWYTRGQQPMLIRWVMVADPEGKDKVEAFFSTDLELNPIQIVEWFVLRWGVEVTFEEVRAHLGVETQRQWSDLAIARTTPALFGLFSLVCLMATRLSEMVEIIPEKASWYPKSQVTFSDVLTIVRRQLWRAKYLV